MYVAFWVLFLLAVPVGLVITWLARFGAARWLRIQAIGLWPRSGVGPTDPVPLWKQLVVVAISTAAAYALPALMFFTAFRIMGDVSYEATEVDVLPGSAADRAGIVSGDSIVGIDATPITTFSEIGEIVRGNAGRSLSFLVDRGGNRRVIVVIPDSSGPNGDGRIGVRAVPQRSPVGLGQALWRGVSTPPQVIAAVVRGIRGISTGADLGGPTGMFGGPLRVLTPIEETAYLFFAAGAYTTYAVPLAFLLAVVTVPRRRHPKAVAAPRAG